MASWLINCMVSLTTLHYICVCVWRPVHPAAWRCVRSGCSCLSVCAQCVSTAAMLSCSQLLTQRHQRNMNAPHSAEACKSHLIYTHTVRWCIDRPPFSLKASSHMSSDTSLRLPEYCISTGDVCVCAGVHAFINLFTVCVCCYFSELKDHTLLTGIFLAVGIDPATTPALESLLSRPFL